MNILKTFKKQWYELSKLISYRLCWFLTNTIVSYYCYYYFVSVFFIINIIIIIKMWCKEPTSLIHIGVFSPLYINSSLMSSLSHIYIFFYY